MQSDILPIIITEGGLKSGGVGKLDLSEPLNKQLEGKRGANIVMEKTIGLNKCPDPNGAIDISIRC